MEYLWYILGMVESIPNEVVFVLSVIAGMIIHYAKKSWKGETLVSFVAWFTHANFRSSVMTLSAAFGAALAAVDKGLVDMGGSKMNIIYTGVITGLAADSMFNSDGTIPSV